MLHEQYHGSPGNVLQTPTAGEGQLEDLDTHFTIPDSV